MSGLRRVRAMRLDFDSYDPPASELVTFSAVSGDLGLVIHTVMRARDEGHLWAVNLNPNGRASWCTTWRAVADWMTSGHYYGPRTRSGAAS